ncbi:symmetrical bis(5'-nucleosyl)-tetraphosphatase [Niveibacterium sp. SC-1]|uniref:symmetrical bis(5'-nucleosyl)-tetraphosphatase n=1 Tax=Niveibacterium sp. SC-1 TaxID=3135646 RepID=UPI00311EE1E0
MARYVVGDLQGQFDSLLEILRACDFDPESDRLWLCGDLVNRGKSNLQVLRYLRDLGDACVPVLGNHDFYLLGVACGAIKRSGDDSLDDVLEAPDRDDLIDWLRAQPLMHVEDDFALVHAGLLAEWTVTKATALAAEVESELRGARWREFLAELWGGKPTRWSDNLRGVDRLRVIVNAMCRMRMCATDGEMLLKYKGGIADAPTGVVPWFRVPGRQSLTHTVFCGHWSALGFHDDDGIVALDTGCVWGRSLTAIRLEDRQVFSVPCPAAAVPDLSE